MLNGVLQLGEVENAESFARKVLDERLTSLGAFLNPTEYDDALSYLVAEAWLIWERFDDTRGVRFSTFAYRILWRRVASWYRQRWTDTRYRARPTMVSIEDNDLDELGEDRVEFSQINVSALTPDGRKILEKVARPIVEEDLSLEQAGRRFGYGRRWSRDQLDKLAVELAPMVDLSRRRWPYGGTSTAAAASPPTPASAASCCERARHRPQRRRVVGSKEGANEDGNGAVNVC